MRDLVPDAAQRACDAPLIRDPLTHDMFMEMGPRISSAPRPEAGALRCIRGTQPFAHAAFFTFSGSVCSIARM